MSQHSWPLQKSVANSKQGFELSSLQPVAELDCYLWGVVYTAMLDHSSGRRKKLQWRPVIKLVFLSQHFIQVNLYLTLMKDVIRYMCKPDRSLSSTLSQLLWQRMFSPAVLVMSSYHDFGLKCTFSPRAATATLWALREIWPQINSGWLICCNHLSQREVWCR